MSNNLVEKVTDYYMLNIATNTPDNTERAKIIIKKMMENLLNTNQDAVKKWETILKNNKLNKKSHERRKKRNENKK